MNETGAALLIQLAAVPPRDRKDLIEGMIEESLEADLSSANPDPLLIPSKDENAS